MHKAFIFGGTTEGRQLCEFCAQNGVPVLYCAVTEDGTRPAEAFPNVNTHVGRLNADGIAGLIERYSPVLVIDATHPYACEVSRNICEACSCFGTRLVRIIREDKSGNDFEFCGDMNDLIPWLKHHKGNIFVTTGTSSAAAFTELADFQNRVWMRILPNLSSLQICLELGYRPERLICMWGPFSVELNYAMFQNANARILITKASGAVGGFHEKITAAKKLGMLTAVISRPETAAGIKPEDAYKMLLELKT